ncbi:hypothetical protein ND747_15590, partial [Frankia sp. R82]|nr:hypothetical protein [Frankia sp. R82]
MRPPAATAEMIRRHELGKVFPGVAYRRAYCRLFGVTEPELGFRPLLSGETVAARRPYGGWRDTPLDDAGPVLTTALPGFPPGPPGASSRPAGTDDPALGGSGAATTPVDPTLPLSPPAPSAAPVGASLRAYPGPWPGGSPRRGASAPGAAAWTRRSSELLAAFLSTAVNVPARPAASAPS